MENPNALADTVRKVIAQNESVGYPPNLFKKATENEYAENLLQICERLICKPETLAWIEKAIEAFPVRTLEDEVVESSNGLGLSPVAIREAKVRVEWFNTLREKHGTMPSSY